MSGAAETIRRRWLRLRAAACRDSLAAFTKEFWSVVEPSVTLQWAWCHDAMCLHLEAVEAGLIKNLAINVPPGSSKSTIVSVMYPAWCLARNPSWRGIFGSYGRGLSNRDSRKCRRIIQSRRYRTMFCRDWGLVGDANRVEFYETSRTGFRMATTCPGSEATGHRGDQWGLDDPQKAFTAKSPIHRERLKDWLFEEFWNRLNNLSRGGRIICQQRFHEDDATGATLARFGTEGPDGIVHLRIPAEFEADNPCTTHIHDAAGRRHALWRDPRTVEGELFDPVRFSESVLAVEQRSLGASGYASQYQQRPQPASGALFKVDRIRRARSVPRMVARVWAWDKAATMGGGAYSAGVLLGVDEAGRYWVLKVIRGQWSVAERESRIRRAAESTGYEVPIWIEQEPGSGGKESAEATIARLAGFAIRAQPASGAGSKEARAEPFAIQVENGNVCVPPEDWVEDYLGELELFPSGLYKDQVDATSLGFNKLAESSRTFDNEGPLAGGQIDDGPYGGAGEPW